MINLFDLHGEKPSLRFAAECNEMKQEKRRSYSMFPKVKRLHKSFIPINSKANKTKKKMKFSKTKNFFFILVARNKTIY